MKNILVLLVAVVFSLETEAATWWRGNLHTHSLWSDGDQYPELITEWYKTNGYHFLALSDHNIVLNGEKWIPLGKGRLRAFERYLERFGSNWVEQRFQQNTQHVRLKTLGEFRWLFEERNRFLLIPSEEITDKEGKLPLHLNGTNLRFFIPPQGGTGVVDVLQRNVDAVLRQRKETGQPMFPHINHPNFGWAIQAEELMQIRGERFFEVYNGHPQVHNEGRSNRVSTEKMWDIVLAGRLGKLNLGVMYGLAVDDSHHYHQWRGSNSNPGRGWVMVRSKELTPPGIIAALEAGDFYASSGVALKEVKRTSNQLMLEVDAQPGVEYAIQMIGTRRGKNAPVGEVLAESKGLRAEYRLRGDELYVRAKVTASKRKENSAVEEYESAWVQPIIGKKL